MKLMAERGWHADLCLIRPDASATVELEQQLGRVDDDCVVIGGGLRMPARTWCCSSNWSTPCIAPRPRRRSPSTPRRRTPRMRRGGGSRQLDHADENGLPYATVFCMNTLLGSSA
jgi:hypothetical protein